MQEKRVFFMVSLFVVTNLRAFGIFGGLYLEREFYVLRVG